VTAQIAQTREQQEPKPAAESYPGHEVTPAEDWNEFSARVKVASEEGKPEYKKEPEDQQHHTDLKKLSPQQFENWKKTGEAPQEKQPAKSAPATEGEGKQPAKAEAAEAAERQNEQPRNLYDRILERAATERDDFEVIVQRMNEPFFPASQDGYARHQVLNYALTQVPNGADVAYFLACPENAELALKMQDAPPHKIAAIAHMISAELRFGGRRANNRSEENRPRPRAPKPPAEVGGRGTAPDDPEKEALKNNDFRTLEQVWNRKAVASFKARR
jgi:hypothetical protein